jgi:hypothetical protein
MSCIYCNSKTYGRPCLFSPTNTHVHMDEPNRCIYCGSKYLGTGCLFNPYGKVHVRGPEFLNRVQEQTEKSNMLKYLYETVKGFTDIKFLSPLGRFYKRLSEIIANSGEPLLESFEFQNKPTYNNLSKEQFVQATEIKERLIEQYKEINHTIKVANLALPQEIVEEIVIDAIMSNNEHTKN